MDKRLKEYIKGVDGISQTTFDPHGPGVVRIHLVPPKKIGMGIPWVIILNGKDIIPVSLGWAILLREFINVINSNSKVDLTKEDISSFVDETVINVKKVFNKTKEDILKDDLKEIIKTLSQVARGEQPSSKIGFMTLKEYAPIMAAPHRMDLMISSMQKNDHWHCNQKCIHCYAGNQTYANTEELSTDEWKTIIDKCKENLIPQITFTGGEPTLREDLVELVKYSEWFTTRLNTNGQLLTSELCSKLYDANLDNVQVTLYSNIEEIHNKLVGTQGFNNTINGIKNAISSGLNVSINTPLCKLNSNYVEFVKYCHEVLGLTYFTCSGLIITGNAENDESSQYRLTKEEITDVVKSAYEYAKDNSCEISFTSPGWIEDEVLLSMNMNIPSCGACSSNMAITPNGLVVPCQSWLSDDNLGSMLNDSWVDIWESKKCKTLRKENLKNDHECPLSKRNEVSE